MTVLLAILARWQGETPRPTAPRSLGEGMYRVERVVDGDTLLLSIRERVRLLGIDTPETKKEGVPVQPWGPEATEFTERFIAGRPVRLTFDRERVDQFGRLLAYVWQDGRLLNEELLRAGLARAEFGFHYSPAMKTRFRRAQDEARRERLGIWSRPRDAAPAGIE